MRQFSHWNKGIVLVTGETGSGKSTTLAAILDQINQTRPVHIITLEDPIEYVYTPQRAIINQREVGVDVEDYEHGLYASLREDPDVILIGEMRTPETIETALVAAETGHLVFSTLHTNSAVDSIDRIVGVFPENKQPQIRLQLSHDIESSSGTAAGTACRREGARGSLRAYDDHDSDPESDPGRPHSADAELSVVRSKGWFCYDGPFPA